MKYRELPASETNDFKVGDTVKVYMIDPFEGTVCDLHNDEVQVAAHENGLRSWEHFKCCRHLETIKAREFWLCYLDGSDELYVSQNDPDLKNQIKVREVLEEE